MANVTSSTVRLISWNIKGLGGAVKRCRVLSHLKRLKPDRFFAGNPHEEQRSKQIEMSLGC